MVGMTLKLFLDKYRNADLLLAWEHISIGVLVTLIKHRFDNVDPIPEWPNSDYDMFLS
jgi:hypothetical protein